MVIHFSVIIGYKTQLLFCFSIQKIFFICFVNEIKGTEKSLKYENNSSIDRDLNL